MKALSIRQPWAWLIVNGHKSIENRDWNCRKRGTIWIHAGLSMTKSAYEECEAFAYERGVVLPPAHHLPRGGIVGEATIVDCVTLDDYITESDSPWFCGDYGIVLRDAKPCELKPCKGQLGFFTPDIEVKR